LGTESLDLRKNAFIGVLTWVLDWLAIRLATLSH
jgi:hypothetical protein